MLKETFSLDDIYNKVFKKFFDSIDRVIVINEQGARIENKVDWKKNEGRFSLANKFRVLVASPFYMSEGQMLFCGNNQNVNAIMKKKPQAKWSWRGKTLQGYFSTSSLFGSWVNRRGAFERTYIQ